MAADMKLQRAHLAELLETDELTSGMDVRAHGDHLIVARIEHDGERSDRVRFSRLAGNAWGLSVKRHTGRWERTPFSGSMSELHDVVMSFMQHLVAP